MLSLTPILRVHFIYVAQEIFRSFRMAKVGSHSTCKRTPDTSVNQNIDEAHLYVPRLYEPHLYEPHLYELHHTNFTCTNPIIRTSLIRSPICTNPNSYEPHLYRHYLYEPHLYEHHLYEPHLDEPPLEFYQTRDPMRIFSTFDYPPLSKLSERNSVIQ